MAAPELKIKISGDSSGLTREIDKAYKSLLGFSPLTKGISKNFEDVKRSIQGAVSITDQNGTTFKLGEDAKTLKLQYREAVKEVQNIIDKFGITSKEAAQAASKAADFRDRIGDANDLIAAFNPDAKFRAFTNSIQTAAGAFSVFQGAFAVLGVESKDLEKQLLKVQGALAITQGLQSIGQGLDSFKQLASVVQNSTIFIKANELATKLATVAQTAFGVAVDVTSVSFRVLKVAIASTGILLLVVAVGQVISAFNSWTTASQRAEEQQKKLNDEVLKGANTQLKGELDFLDREEKFRLAQAKAAQKSGQEILNIEQSFRRSRIESYTRFLAETKNLTDEQKDLAQKAIKDLNNEGQIANLDFITNGLKVSEKESNTILKKYEDDLQSLKNKLAELQSLDQQNLLPRFKKIDITNIQDQIDELEKSINKIKGIEVPIDPTLDQILLESRIKEASDAAKGVISVKVVPLEIDGNLLTKSINTAKAAAAQGPVNLSFQSQLQGGLIDSAKAQEAENKILSIDQKAKTLSDTLTSTLSPAFSTLFDGILSGSKNAFQSFGQMILGIIKKLASAAIQAAIFAAIISIAFPGAGGFGASFGGNFKSIFGQLGGIKFAEGGIVNGPTLGLVGEAGREAIIPLDRLGEVIGSIGGNQSVFVTGQLSGETIYLQQQRVDQRRGRFV